MSTVDRRRPVWGEDVFRGKEPLDDSREGVNRGHAGQTRDEGTYAETARAGGRHSWWRRLATRWMQSGGSA